MLKLIQGQFLACQKLGWGGEERCRLGSLLEKNLSSLLRTFRQLSLFEGFRDDQSGGESDTYVTKPLQQNEIQH